MCLVVSLAVLDKMFISTIMLYPFQMLHYSEIYMFSSTNGHAYDTVLCLSGYL